ncbi:MAG: hypothetical protein FH748_00585 [Balneolaceae bacterium]|nr:hypothetical protein [Balneolaceae bacterium]
MKKLYLHLGSPKTGTSSIQRLLFQNKVNINQQGFTYPGREINHHKLWFVTEGERADMPRQFSSVKPAEMKRSVDQFTVQLENDIETGNTQQIISTEYLFIHNEEYVRRAAEYLKRFYSEITVLLFVRNPVDYYKSVQQQMIKARSYVESPYEYTYIFRKVIEMWKQFFDVQVYEYSPKQNSLVVFCNKIGLDYNSLDQAGKRTNVSLSIEQMLLLEKIQRNIYTNKEDVFKPHLNVIQEVNAPFSTKPRIKDWVKEVVYEKHSEDLEWLKEEYNIEFARDFGSAKGEQSNPTSNDNQIELRDIYYVEEKLSERYEALIMDVLLKELVKRNTN